MLNVWVTDERVWGELLNYGAFVSLVRYTVQGILYEVFLENDEFIIFGEDDETE